MTEGFDFTKLSNLAQGHAADIGLRFVGSGDDWAEMALDYDPRFAINATSGVLASGPVLSLIDSASGLSIFARRKFFAPMATLDLRVDYLRAAPPGKTIIARATCYHVTRNVAFVRCDAHDGDPGDLIAHAMATFFFTGE